MKGRASLDCSNRYSQIEPLNRRVLLAFQPLIDAAPSDPTGMIALNGKVIFYANDGIHGRELWSTDGTTVGTKLLYDIIPGPGDWNQSVLVKLGNKAYFVGPTETTPQFPRGWAIWSTDGTTIGTKPIVGLKDADPISLIPAKDAMYVVANNPYTGGGGCEDYTDEVIVNDSDPPDYSLYYYNTITGKTNLIDDYIGAGFEFDMPHAVAGGKLYYYAHDVDTGSELHVTNGTSVRLVKDIYPGEPESTIGEMAVLNGIVYFPAYDDKHGLELWRTDGTTGGTKILREINTNPGDNGLAGSVLKVTNNKLYFFANDGVHGTGLWTSDGTYAGTKMLRNVSTDWFSYYYADPTNFTSIGSKVYFIGNTDALGTELWLTDGTTSGTRLVKDIVPGAGSARIRSLTAVGNTLFFVAWDLQHGLELWKTNSSGTSIVADISPYETYFSPTSLVAFGNKLLYCGDDFWHGGELWCSDGTAAGTKLVKDIHLPRASIFGQVFIDQDHDGKWDAGEKGAEGRVVWLDLNNNRQLDEGEPSYQTDYTGRYFFADLQPGYYVIRQLLPSGWNQSSPVNNWGFKVTLSDGQQYRGAYHATWHA